MSEDLTNRTKECPICHECYEKCLYICPNCGYKEPISYKSSIIALCLFFLVAVSSVVVYGINQNKHLLKNIVVNTIKEQEQEQEQEQENFETTADEYSENDINIPIRPMSELSYLTKEEILTKRKEYVAESVIFDGKYYSPNENVYQIQDGLPWISAYQVAKYGVQDNPDIGEGDSRSSISVNNPELLVSIITPDFSKKNSDKSKFSKADYFMPKKLSWNKEENTIKAYFDIKSFYEMNPDYIGMVIYTDETNAIDMGYNWVYCIESRNVKFVDEENNISKAPYKMKGYYHKGRGCRLSTGCNNYSPYQSQLLFSVLENSGYLKLKMWKEEPESEFQEADIIYEMYL